MPVAAGGARASDLEQIEPRDWLSGERLIWRCNASNCLSLETSTALYCVSSYHHQDINNARLLLLYNMPYCVCSRIV